MVGNLPPQHFQVTINTVADTLASLMTTMLRTGCAACTLGARRPAVVTAFAALMTWPGLLMLQLHIAPCPLVQDQA